MFNDIDLNKEIREKYIASYGQSLLEPLILTSGNWPKLGFTDDFTEIPETLKSYLKEFEFFYKGRDSSFGNRALEWKLSEGKAVVIMNIPNGKKYNLFIRGHWLPILLLFNQDKTVNFQKMREITKMKENLLESYVKIFVEKKILRIKSKVKYIISNLDIN